MTRATAILVLFGFGAVYGQSPAAGRFEVASVKPSKPDQFTESSGIKTGKGRLTASNVTLKRCVMGAFGLGPNQIAGGPTWLDSDRYEIIAKADQPVGDAALMTMLRALLIERFKLAIHRETRTIEAFVLDVAKNGPKLEKAEETESSTNSSRGLIDAKTITMDRFAEVLSRQMDLPVVNQTRLEGSFNLKLEWSTESGRPVRDGTGDVAMETEVSIFTAIQQELGLRLRARKTPVEVIVIDHAEKPSEN
ncbi:MAG: TIGR03435 family protein [Bryobacteraceae bacterium]